MTAQAQVKKVEFQVAVKDAIGSQKVNVTSAVSKDVRHQLSAPMLKQLETSSVDSGPFQRELEAPLRELFGPQFSEIAKAIGSTITSRIFLPKEGVLIIDSGRPADRYNATIEFHLDGSVRAAFKDRGSSGRSGIATCTDFGRINPGFFCEKDFGFDR
jgi:hypothetical protein